MISTFDILEELKLVNYDNEEVQHLSKCAQLGDSQYVDYTIQGLIA